MEELGKGWPEAVKRPFRAIIFDWDGTAVMSRSEKVPELIRVLERALREGILLVVVTGTKIENLSGQVAPQSRRRGRQSKFREHE